MSEAVTIMYGRTGIVARFRTQNATTEEIRSLICALWAILGPADRMDMIRELAHYQETGEEGLPPVAREIMAKYREEANNGLDQRDR